ncbi:MAG: FecR family protein [Methyloglobulus sp.]|nr:FecR family protein [Methyloglobulus sp.]
MYPVIRYSIGINKITSTPNQSMDKLKPQHREWLEAEAVSWHIRLTSGDVTAIDKAEFEGWLSRSPAHGQAYQKILTLWGQLDIPLLAHRKLYGEITRDEIADALSKSSNTAFSLWDDSMDAGGRATSGTVAEKVGMKGFQPANWIKGLAVAASIAITTVLGFYPDYLRNPWADYRTHIGEHTTINLTDGSIVHLNTDSAINVTLTDQERHVALLRGEAEFEVAHDSQRPFAVTSGQVSTQAIGTKFLVRYDANQGVVTLLDGKVRTSSIPIDRQTRNKALLKPGDQVTFQDSRISPITHPDVTNADAWKKGQLLMNFVTLEQALAEINRYRRGTVKLLDNKLAQREINAAIDIGNIDAWLDTLEGTLPLRVHHVGPLVLVTAK